MPRAGPTTGNKARTLRPLTPTTAAALSEARGHLNATQEGAALKLRELLDCAEHDFATGNDKAWMGSLKGACAELAKQSAMPGCVSNALGLTIAGLASAQQARVYSGPIKHCLAYSTSADDNLLTLVAGYLIGLLFRDLAAFATAEFDEHNLASAASAVGTSAAELSTAVELYEHVSPSVQCVRFLVLLKAFPDLGEAVLKTEIPPEFSSLAPASCSSAEAIATTAMLACSRVVQWATCLLGISAAPPTHLHVDGFALEECLQAAASAANALRMHAFPEAAPAQPQQQATGSDALVQATHSFAVAACGALSASLPKDTHIVLAAAAVAVAVPALQTQQLSPSTIACALAHACGAAAAPAAPAAGGVAASLQNAGHSTLPPTAQLALARGVLNAAPHPVLQSAVSVATDGPTSLLSSLLALVLVSCSAADVVHRMQALRTLELWLKVAQGLLAAAHTQDITTVLSASESSQILDALLVNWGHHSRLISGTMGGLLKQFLKLDAAATAAATAGQAAAPVGTLAGQLLQQVALQPMQMKGKYYALQSLVEVVGAKGVQGGYPALMQDMLDTVTARCNMEKPALAVLAALLEQSFAETVPSAPNKSKSKQGSANLAAVPDTHRAQCIQAWRDSWQDVVLGALLGPHAVLRDRVVSMLLPPLVKVDGGCLPPLLNHVAALAAGRQVSDKHQAAEKVAAKFLRSERESPDSLDADGCATLAHVALLKLARKVGRLQQSTQEQLFGTHDSAEVARDLETFLPSVPAWYDSEAWSPPAPPSPTAASAAGEGAVHVQALRRALRHTDPELRLQALELVAGGMGQHGPTLKEMGFVAQYLAEYSTVEQSEVLKRLGFILESLLRRVDEAARPALRRVRWMADLTAAVQGAGTNALPGAALVVQGVDVKLTASMLSELSKPKEEYPEWLMATACGRFVAWLLRMGAAGMYPGAPAERGQPAALLLQSTAPLAVQWFDEAHASPAAQDGRFPCACAVALRPLLSPSTVAQLYQSCDSSWEPVRTAACDVLAMLPAPLPTLLSPESVVAAASRAVAAIASPRAREAEAGALQLLTLYRVYVQGLHYRLQLQASGQCVVLPQEGGDHVSVATGMVRSLCDEVLRRAGSLAHVLRQHGLDVPDAQEIERDEATPPSGSTPPLLHGLLLALSHIVRASPLALLRTAQVGTAAGNAASQWRATLAHVLSACAAANGVAMVVVADTVEEDGDVVGGPPDQASARVEEGAEENGQAKGRVDCRGHLLLSSSETGAAGGGQGSEGGLQHESTHDENPLHLLVVGAWQIIKEATNCVATVLEQAPLGDQAQGGLITVAQAQGTGDSMLSALLTLKHMGGVLHASHGFTRLCRVLLSSTVPGAKACVAAWLSSLLHRVAAKHQQFILRRSAGFAMAFLAIVRAEAAAAGHAQPLMDTAVSHLLVNAAGEEHEQVAMRAALLQLGVAEGQLPAPTVPSADADGGKATMWRRQVHARNVLRAIARDGAVARRLGRFLPLALSQALDGFASPSWALRNSSLMVFSTVVTALVGSKRVDEAASEQNLRSARQLFAAYPSLQGMLVTQLEGGVRAVLGGAVAAEDPVEGGPAPTLYPLLLLLGRLSADESTAVSEDEDGDVSLGAACDGVQGGLLCPLLRQLAASPQLWVRKAAGAALASLTPLNSVPELLGSVSVQLQECVGTRCVGSANTAHGLLLQLRWALNKYLYSSSGTFKHAWGDLVQGGVVATLPEAALSAVIAAGRSVHSSVLQSGHKAPVVAAAALQVLAVAWHVAVRSGSDGLAAPLQEAAALAGGVLAHAPPQGPATATDLPPAWATVQAALQGPAPCTSLPWVAPLTSALSTVLMLHQLASSAGSKSSVHHDQLCLALGRGLTHPQPEVRSAMGKCARRMCKALHDPSVSHSEASEATPLLQAGSGAPPTALLAAIGDVLREIVASEQHEGVMRFVFRALRVCIAGSAAHGSWDAPARAALTARCLAVASSARNSKLRNHALLLAAWCVSRPAAPLAQRQGMAGVAAAVASAACDTRSFVARIAAARALHTTAPLWATAGGGVAPAARLQAWGTVWGLLNDEDAEVRDAVMAAACSVAGVESHAPLGGMVQLLLRWVAQADVPGAAAMGMLFALVCSGLSNEHLAQRQAAAMDESWGTPAWIVQRLANDPQLEVVAPAMGVPPSALRVAVRLARDTFAEFAQRPGSEGPVQAQNNATRVFQPEGNNEHSESILLVWYLAGGIAAIVQGASAGVPAAATALKQELGELQQAFDLSPAAQERYCCSTDRVTRELAHAYLRNMHKLQNALG